MIADWNVVTGQTTVVKPKPIQRLSSVPEQPTRLSKENSAVDKRAKRGPLDAALSARVPTPENCTTHA